MKRKIFLSFILGVFGFSSIWAQATAADPAAPSKDTTLLSNIFIYILVAAVLILLVVTLSYMLQVNRLLYKKVLNLQAEKSGVTLPGESYGAAVEDDFWTRLRKKYWEDAVPMEREHEIMGEHVFDGIRELDNRLPPWWVNMFLITVIWGGIYMWYYHFGGSGPSSAKEYEIAVETAKKEMATALAGKANLVDENTVVALTDPAALAEGSTTFKSVCAACHGQAGEGGVGPNLTDEFWIHGGGAKNVFKTIKYGVPDKGMISWQSQLKPSDMQKVTSYILTLKGTNPANPKEPQGEKWVEEAAAPAATPAADTTKTN